MADEHILVDRREAVGIITLNRPRALNAMNYQLSKEMNQALVAFDEDDAIRAVILTGAGDRAFSAGADIKENAAISHEEYLQRQRERAPWGAYIANYRKPLIGALNGLCYGGAAQLAATLDIRVGCERTTFRYLPANYGRINSTWNLPLVVGYARAMELLLTARVVEPEEAHRIGLLHHLVSAEEVLPKALELANLIAANHPQSVMGIKTLLREQVGMGYLEARENESRAQRERFQPTPIREGFKDFLERKGVAGQTV